MTDGRRKASPTLIEHKYLVTAIEDVVNPGYVLRGTTFETRAALQVYEPWELRLFGLKVCGWIVVGRFLGFQGRPRE